MSSTTHRWMKIMTSKRGPHRRVNSSIFTTNILRRALEMMPDPCGYIHPLFEKSLYFERNRKANIKTENLNIDNEISKKENLNIDKEISKKENLNIDKEISKKENLNIDKEISKKENLNIDKEISKKENLNIDKENVSLKNLNSKSKKIKEEIFIDKIESFKENISENKNVNPINNLQFDENKDIGKFILKTATSIDSIMSPEIVNTNKHLTLNNVECIDLKNVSEFLKCMNFRARSYIISDNIETVEKLKEILENLKNKISINQWNSFRIIMFDSNVDVKTSLLNAISTGKETEENEKSNEKESDLSEDMSTISHLSNLEIDTKIKYCAQRKYRDSCIITRERLPDDIVLDPISKCFENLTKLIQDEIFSVHNHIAAQIKDLDNLISSIGVVKFVDISQ